MNRQLRQSCTILFALLVAVTTHAAGDPDRGADLAVACAACHGADGNSPSPAFPIIAGQHEAYLLQSLQAYRDRERDHAIMTATVINMMDQQLEDLAAYFANQEGLGAGPAAAGAPAQQQAGVPGASVLAATGVAAAAGGVVAATTSCPELGADVSTSADADGDGLADAFDALPEDPDEFVADTDGNARFEICSIEQLQAILTLGEGDGAVTGLAYDARMSRDYELGADIDAGSLPDYRPVGNCGPEQNCMVALDKFGFSGTLNGNGFVVRNLRIEQPMTGGGGLIGVLARDGNVATCISRTRWCMAGAVPARSSVRISERSGTARPAAKLQAKMRSVAWWAATRAP